MADEDKTLLTLGTGPAAVELYKDLLQPTTQELGKNLHAVSKLVLTALAPVRGLVWGMDRIKEFLLEELTKRLAKVPPEDIRSPSGYLAGQAVLQLTFCADEPDLRELYANLLAAAMNSRTASNAHPAFVEVIQQLSPDEALVLAYLALLPADLNLTEDSVGGATVSGKQSITAQFREFCDTAGVANPSMSNEYLDNLLRLRIFSERTTNPPSFVPTVQVPTQPVQWALQMTQTRIAIGISDFGRRFVATCVSNGGYQADAKT